MGAGVRSEVLRMERRLAAILAADVVGYSGLMGTDEAGTLQALMSIRTQIIDPNVAQHRGRIFKTTGDGVLVEFPSVVNAVSCGVEIQRRMIGETLQMRIGIHLGDVIVEGEDIFGDGVNIAARLEGVAPAGGVAISASAHEHVGNRVELGFEDMGEHALKNIERPVKVYRAMIAGAHGLPNSAKPASTHANEGPSIAVLPFTNMSGDPQQTYFADGITEDIITELSRTRGLTVIARNSTFTYRDKAVDVRRVAQELNVRYVVEGSVRKMANRVRITAQLIDAASGSHLWSERFDRSLDDLFDIQDEVTQTIVATTTGRVEEAEIKNASRKQTNNLSAYDCLLRGVELLRSFGPDVNRRARELFEQAIALDQKYALAHAYLALALIIENRYSRAPDDIKQRALDTAMAAVRLDPRESRCHIFLGQVHRFRDEYDLAISHLEQGIALNPNDATGMLHLSAILAASGRAHEGIEALQRAIKIDPYLRFYWGTLATCLYALKRYDEALAAHRKAGRDKSPWQLAKEAACLARLGRINEAQLLAAEVVRRNPSFSVHEEMPHYKFTDDAENLRQGLLMAGLPE